MQSIRHGGWRLVSYVASLARPEGRADKNAMLENLGSIKFSDRPASVPRYGHELSRRLCQAVLRLYGGQESSMLEKFRYAHEWSSL